MEIIFQFQGNFAAMEVTQNLGMKKEDSPEIIPSLIRSIDSNLLVGLGLGFDAGLIVKQNASDFVLMIEPASSDTKFHSQPIPTGVGFDEAVAAGKFPNGRPRNPRVNHLKDERYNSFKTWSGKLERQISTLRGKPPTKPPVSTPRSETLTVDRYFDALEGPELDTLRPSEEIILPDDKNWPFLLRYPISAFGVCLGVSSQAIMWKNLSATPSTHFLHVSPNVNLILWIISMVLFVVVAAIYLLKLVFYFEAVRREYYHPIRVNFFFAPWIALLFLVIGVPATVTTNLPHFLCGCRVGNGGCRRWRTRQPLIGGRELCGSFVGCVDGVKRRADLLLCGRDGSLYGVVCDTVSETSDERNSAEGASSCFLSVCCCSECCFDGVGKINGSFDYGSRIAYFIAMFLYFSLAVRVNFFRGFRFSLAWWAYTFPMTGAAIATIGYSSEVPNIATKTLSVILSIIATLTVTGLLITTILHAFVFRNLFPNDIVIAISDRKPKTVRKWFHRRAGSCENDMEHYLKFVTSEGKDVDVSVDGNSTKDVESQIPLPAV
ncbi:hypothetical protein OSB04_017077 [Centaurea solstitialis]|uniref:Uncharacterized protein n=1 Tax=Centaurea solstitialis TaxID=347529 RepID=A0AA38TKC8_9ASTR|nr:hypothetical protein OSB04_017077 [Centaurea solstitialis]